MKIFEFQVLIHVVYNIDEKFYLPKNDYNEAVKFISYVHVK